MFKRDQLRNCVTSYKLRAKRRTIMLSDTLYRVRRIDGLQNLQRRGAEGGAKELTSSRLRLPATGTHRYQVASEESVIVLQEGRGTFKTTAGEWTLARRGVF